MPDPRPTIGEEMIEPCPFCGGRAEAWLPSDEDGNVKYVWCVNSVSCGGELTLHEPGQDAIAAWNKRTTKGETDVG